MVTAYEEILERFREAQRLAECASGLERYCQSGPNAGKPGPCPKQGGPKIKARPKGAAGKKSAAKPAPRKPAKPRLHPQVHAARAVEAQSRKELATAEKALKPHERKLQATSASLSKARAARDEAKASGDEKAIKKASKAYFKAAVAHHAAEAGHQEASDSALWAHRKAAHDAAKRLLEEVHQRHGIGELANATTRVGPFK